MNEWKKVIGKNCKRTIRYQRPFPPLPATYADDKLPEEYTTTTNNQQFLQYDNGQNAENRMLVFYSPDSLERLANAQTFFMNGTFSVAPHPFKQLYTIRIRFKDVAVTAVYAFLRNKCRYLLGTLPVYCWQLPCQQPATQCPDYHHRLWRYSPSCSYNCIWSPHQPPGLFLPPDTSIMAKDTAASLGVYIGIWLFVLYHKQKYLLFIKVPHYNNQNF